MFPLSVIGLSSHISANRAKSLALFGVFAALSFVVLYIVLLFVAAFTRDLRLSGMFLYALALMKTWWPAALLGAGAWGLIGYMWNGQMVAALTGARDITRKRAPRFYALVENICVSRGMPTPRLMLMETSALNAYASGLTSEDATITVTRGLIDHLDDDELEAILAHELTHLINGDTQLMMAAIIYCDAFGFLSGMFGGGERSASAAGESTADESFDVVGRWYSDSKLAVAVIVAAIVLPATAMLALLSRLAISRAREFMADAGAVELTKNPDALASALRKVYGRARIVDVSEHVASLFIASPCADEDEGWFATHPSLDARLDALRTYAGAQDVRAPGLTRARETMFAPSLRMADAPREDVGLTRKEDESAGPWGTVTRPQLREERQSQAIQTPPTGASAFAALAGGSAPRFQTQADELISTHGSAVRQPGEAPAPQFTDAPASKPPRFGERRDGAALNSFAARMRAPRGDRPAA